MDKKPSFMQRLSFVFSPKENKGTNMLERAITTFMLKGSDAWTAREENPQEKRLLDSLARLSEKMHVPKPSKLIIYKCDKPNAAKLPGGTIVVGTDLMRIVNDEQMDAILGHELSHYKHGWQDLGVLAAIAIAAGTAANVVLNKIPRSRWNRVRDFDEVNDVMMEMGVAELATLPYRRYMETMADKEGAELVSPEAMAGGLLVLEKRADELRLEEYRRKHGKDANPNDASWVEKGWRNFVRTLDPHPLTKDRVAALEKMKHGERHETNHELQTQR